jgi:FixJ family two-component response regulator
MRQVLPMFGANGESHRAKIIFCGIEVDDQLQALVQQEADLIAVSHPGELARYGSETSWGCLVAGDAAAADGEALEMVARFAQERPGFSWLVWSSELDWPAAMAAMQRGAFNVLRSLHDDAALPASLASATHLGHQRFLAWRQANDVRRRFGDLSASEGQVLALLMKGWTNKAISLQLDFSLRTVESRRHKILGVMQTENLITLAALLAQHGLLEQIDAIAGEIDAAKPHSASA